MMQFFLLLIFAVSAPAFAQSEGDVYERLKVLEKRLAEVEATSSLDYIQVGGILTSTYDDIAIKETYPVAHDSNSLRYLRMRLSLNVTADLHPNIKVYTRYTTSKFFNRMRYQGSDSSQDSDFGAAYRYNDSQIYLEKAYVDFSLDKWNLSVGRLPTVDGGPSHLWDYRARQGTYPFLNFNVPLDGFAFTYKMDSILPEKHYLAIRALYTPLSMVNFGGTNDRYLRPPTEDETGDVASGAEIETVIDAGSIQADYGILDSSLASEISTILQTTLLNESPGYSGSGTSTLRTSGQSTSLYFEMVGIKNSQFDFSATFSHTYYRATGHLAPGVGLGTSGEESNMYGNSLLLSTRYRFGNMAVGYEYLDSSRLGMHYATADEDLIRFYRTPGFGHHIYLVHKFSNFVSLRVGYRQKDLTNYLPGAGPVQNSDRELKNFYVRLRTDF